MLRRIPTATTADLHELLPANWKPATAGECRCGIGAHEPAISAWPPTMGTMSFTGRLRSGGRSWTGMKRGLESGTEACEDEIQSQRPSDMGWTPMRAAKSLAERPD